MFRRRTRKRPPEGGGAAAPSTPASGVATRAVTRLIDANAPRLDEIEPRAWRPTSSAYGANTHGGGKSAHDLPDAATSPAQQLAAPPGRAAQPTPPHSPQDAAQHALPLGMPVSHGASPCGASSCPSGASMMQGGTEPEQRTPACRIELAQQLAAPPGRAPHPSPPHEPHDAAQHASPSARPVAHVGSDAA
jgi:hypothetical protein